MKKVVTLVALAIVVTSGIVLSNIDSSATSGLHHSSRAAGEVLSGGSSDFSYIDSASTPKDLLSKSAAVIFGQPTGTESILRPDSGDGIRIMGQSFLVTEVLKGSLSSDDEITIARTDVTAASSEPQPPYSAKFYLLALVDTQNSYGAPAWYVLGGPSGRMAFTKDENGSWVGAAEDPNDAVERALDGKTVQQVKQAVNGRN